MKNALMLMILLFVHVHMLYDDCNTVYKCAETLKDHKCMAAEYTADEITIFHLNDCSIHHACRDQMEQIGVCYKRDLFKFALEKCTVNPECFSTKCVDYRCVGIEDGQFCTESAQCNAQSICDNNGLCKKISQPGEICANEDDCTFGYICTQKNSLSEVKSCLKMFSIETGQYTSHRLMCKSGYAYNTNSEKYDPTATAEYIGFVCAESTFKSESEECSTRNECKYEISLGGDKKVALTGNSCTCSLDGEHKFCQIATDNDIWTLWLKVYMEILKRPIDERIHTSFIRHRGWDYPILIQAEKFTEHYQEFKSADECAIRYITASSSLTLSYMIILAFAVILF